MFHTSYIELNTPRCNLDCRMCSINRRHPNAIAIDVKTAFLRELRECGLTAPSFSVIPFGGEPLTNMDELRRLLSFSGQ